MNAGIRWNLSVTFAQAHHTAREDGGKAIKRRRRAVAMFDWA
jgi:hypothetical protein